ncbi:MAG: AMP-dependent synthetase [Betaproteobacteria bacterium RIFCSPLOWO2_02_FULL_66_14]|nr:MAG: AMP-dependent synthetase [Betaproteobacteria bacterium RIFCSPLOWO2_02_FULL_66_14]
MTGLREAAPGIAWRPDAATIEQANLTAFMRATGIAHYEELIARADADPEWFYDALLGFLDYRFYRPYARVLDASAGAPWTRWCVGGTTNVVLNALDRWRGTPTRDKTLLAWEGEDGERAEFTYRELDREVCRCAGALRALGLGRGDVVAIYLPNLPEAMIAMLAVPKIGAIVMPLFSGFGAEAMRARLELGEAKALITVDGSARRGKPVDAKAIADEAVASLASLRHVIVCRRAGNPVAWKPGRDHWWHQLLAQQPDDAPTEAMDADAPYLLVFTSGTTGNPKGVVHAHAGFPAKIVMDLALCMDFKPRDRMLWMSDMGWVVGPLIVFAIPIMGGTLVLAEGAPNYPDPERMWRLVAEQRVSFLGIAPTTARTFIAQASEPWKNHDLSALRIIVSSGEPWTPDAWRWLFERVGGRRIPLLNFSGGTEMMGILACCLLRPLKPCAFNTPVPGTGADVVDDSGRSVEAGTVGELVMRRPVIGLTRSLWRDDARYLENYWSTWPGVWHHGDFASRDAEGHWYIHGRSDDTLKIAGKRTGPAEIEALVMDTGLLAEAAAIGVPDPVKGSALVLVCVPKPGASAGIALREQLSSAVTRGLGTPFKPASVLFVSDLPKTRNLKIMRRVIRAACLGEDPGDLSSLVNPESIDEIRARRSD